MNYETVITVVFFLFLILILYIKRKKLDIQKIIYPILYMYLYRTKWGLKSMNSLAKKYPRFLGVTSYIGVIIGFLGMVFIAYSLIDNFIKTFITPTGQAGVALVLPFEVKGAVYVPILYWLISIFIIAIVHEFSHGIIARVYDIPLKSSGFAFLCLIIPVIPAAFVEPDEKKMTKKSAKAQLSVFAAGPFSNIILAFICLGILLFAITPMASSLVYQNGVEVTSLVEEMPAELSGMKEGELIKTINGVHVQNISDFIFVLDDTKVGDQLLIDTLDENDQAHQYTAELTSHPNNESKSYLGVSVAQSTDIKPEIESSVGRIIPKIGLWFVGLFYWLFLLNLGIGLFNLAPLGPLDGGRMINLVLHKYFKKEKAKMIFKYVSIAFLGLIVIPLLYGFFM